MSVRGLPSWFAVAETLTAGLTGTLAFSDLSALSAKVAL